MDARKNDLGRKYHYVFADAPLGVYGRKALFFYNFILPSQLLVYENLTLGKLGSVYTLSGHVYGPIPPPTHL